MLQLSEVDAYYGKIPALHSISLTAAVGEITMLLGPNGSGKTTTLRTISGLIRARRGSVVFDGTDITRMDAPGIVKLGLVQVPEGRLVFPRLSVFDNLRMGAFTRTDVRAIQSNVERVYGMFPILYKRRSNLAGSLSGGEQQMLAIGRALMANPRMLLLDEPSLGLSPILVEQIAQIVRRICDEGTAILLVEQSALMTLELGGKGYVLENGRIALAGADVHELLRRDEVRQTYMGIRRAGTTGRGIDDL